MDQVETLKQQGYVVVPTNQSAQIAIALRAINGAFYEQGLEPQSQLDFDWTYFPDLACDPRILDLSDGATSFLQRILDVPLLPMTGQIALRFPSGDKPFQPHIDGSYGRTWAPHFSALVAVFLSNVGPNDGAMQVWPGSHLRVQNHVADVMEGRFPPGLLQGDPTPVVGQAGDVMIAHPLLVHSTSAVKSEHIRYTVFFRVKVAAQESIGVELLTNPWLGWL